MVMPSSSAASSNSSTEPSSTMPLAGIEVEHRIDRHAAPAVRVPDQIGDGIGRLVEESPDLRLGPQAALPNPAAPRIGAPIDQRWPNGSLNWP